MIGAERKQKAGIGAVTLQLLDQIGDAFACSAVGVGIDFECDLRQFTGFLEGAVSANCCTKVEVDKSISRNAAIVNQKNGGKNKKCVPKNAFPVATASAI